MREKKGIETEMKNEKRTANQTMKERSRGKGKRES
jgi:hypothetical protein